MNYWLKPIRLFNIFYYDSGDEVWDLLGGLGPFWDYVSAVQDFHAKHV